MRQAQTDKLLIQQARERLAAVMNRPQGDRLFPLGLPSVVDVHRLRAMIDEALCAPQLSHQRAGELRARVREVERNMPVSIRYEQRVVLRDDLADIPPLGAFECLRLSDRMLAMIDAHTISGFVGHPGSMCSACGLPLIQGAQFCIDCGEEIGQPAASSAPALAVTGPTRRLGE